MNATRWYHVPLMLWHVHRTNAESAAQLQVDSGPDWDTLDRYFMTEIL